MRRHEFANQRRLGAGFLPWAFAYSITRVLYGVETLLDG